MQTAGTFAENLHPQTKPRLFQSRRRIAHRHQWRLDLALLREFSQGAEHHSSQKPGGNFSRVQYEHQPFDVRFMASEDTPTQPINPYGWSKLMSERMLRDVAAAHPLRYVALRYFNVAGADPGGRIGQSTPAATHLVKVACEHVVGKRNHISVFGTDYDTPDGTCIRDYIHVEDLASAHLKALEYLSAGGESTTLNCGYGLGFSVREVLAVVARLAGQSLTLEEGSRRAGDPPRLVAAADRIRQVLGWQPQRAKLDEIVHTALEWERRLRARPMT